MVIFQLGASTLVEADVAGFGKAGGSAVVRTFKAGYLLPLDDGQDSYQ